MHGFHASLLFLTSAPKCAHWDQKNAAVGLAYNISVSTIENDYDLGLLRCRVFIGHSNKSIQC